MEYHMYLSMTHGAGYKIVNVCQELWHSSKSLKDFYSSVSDKNWNGFLKINSPICKRLALSCCPTHVVLHYTTVILSPMGTSNYPWPPFLPQTDTSLADLPLFLGIALVKISEGKQTNLHVCDSPLVMTWNNIHPQEREENQSARVAGSYSNTLQPPLLSYLHSYSIIVFFIISVPSSKKVQKGKS